MPNDYKIDTHMHTLVSGHAYNTMKEMIETAGKKDMDVICITEHGPAMRGSCIDFYFTNYRIITKDWWEKPNGKNMKVYFGMETNILNFNGLTDYDDINDTIHDIRFIIASAHKCCIEPGNYGANTAMYMNVMDKPYVSVLGHIDDGYFECDYERIVKKAKEKDILIEVNNSSNAPNGFRLNSNENTMKYLRLCKEYGVKVVLGSDAHWDELIGGYGNILPLLEKVNFPEELIINNDPMEFINFVERKYRQRLEYYGLPVPEYNEEREKGFLFSAEGSGV